MNEENKCSYYSIIPATVRYDSRLAPAEKLLYGEITALANKQGFCFANNRYFADLYKVAIGTVSRWISNLQKFGYIIIEVIRNNKKEVIERRIYLTDTPYAQNCLYPIKKNVKDNNLDDNIFNKIINNSDKISNEFYEILDTLEFLYPQQLLLHMQQDTMDKLKMIIVVLYEIYNSNLKYILNKMDRNTLIKLYSISEMHGPENLKGYFKKSVINNFF